MGLVDLVRRSFGRKEAEAIALSGGDTLGEVATEEKVKKPNKRGKSDLLNSLILGSKIFLGTTIGVASIPTLKEAFNFCKGIDYAYEAEQRYLETSAPWAAVRYALFNSSETQWYNNIKVMSLHYPENPKPNSKQIFFAWQYPPTNTEKVYVAIGDVGPDGRITRARYVVRDISQGVGATLTGRPPTAVENAITFILNPQGYLATRKTNQLSGVTDGYYEVFNPKSFNLGVVMNQPGRNRLGDSESGIGVVKEAYKIGEEIEKTENKRRLEENQTLPFSKPNPKKKI